MNTPAFNLNNTDVKKRLINVIKYVGIPVFSYITLQLQAGLPIDWKLIGIGIAGAIVDILHRWFNDNTIPLGATSTTPPQE